MVSKQFASRLKQLREATELSQTQLAKQLGVSRGSISYYENCERVPDIEFVEKVSDLFGVSLDYLFGHSENLISKNVDIGYITNLSDKSIEKLSELWINVDILNRLIENSNFEKFLDIVNYYCEAYKNLSSGRSSLYLDASIETENCRQTSNKSHCAAFKYLEFYNRSVKDTAEYLEYLLSKVAINIFREIAIEEPTNKYTKEELQEHLKELEQIQKESTDSLNSFLEKMDLLSEKANEDFMLKYKEEMDIRKRLREYAEMQEGAKDGNSNKEG